MLALPNQVRVFVAVEPVDMRKQFDGLWAVSRARLKENPKEGAIFAFSNKARTRLKLLYWDGSGVWVLAKRIEQGKLSWPLDSNGKKLSIKPAALMMLMNGIDLKDGMQKAWYEG
ncbi:IS66 family insertion sequence element accessory protein TnpB [Cerasicoccus frondis]|uniref:IS66 family insertion sequence element accessory protein TnpB n=1 Tax=Cerasicoccus frondis TaxID=490090 RepID=UPI002852801D|nr:IS66 family insertion sequence element accessory protein TnpB [Cerasicoccus frondis]